MDELNNAEIVDEPETEIVSDEDTDLMDDSEEKDNTFGLVALVAGGVALVGGAVAAFKNRKKIAKGVKAGVAAAKEAMHEEESESEVIDVEAHVTEHDQETKANDKK